MQTGAVTVIGPTGFSGIQALDVTTAGLRAWDIGAGLLLISSQTGLATDPFPGVSGPSGLQFLATDPVTGQEYVGHSTLHTVSTLTGVTAPVLTFSGSPDLRGVEFTKSRSQLIGQPCPAANGLPFCSAIVPFGPGLPFSSLSPNHAGSAVGLQIVGFSETVYASVPLPIDLDPVFGTTGCFLHVSADFTMLSVTTPPGNMVVTLNLPSTIAFLQFYIQHAVLEPVPGGISFSNGLRVRPGL